MENEVTNPESDRAARVTQILQRAGRVASLFRRWADEVEALAGEAVDAPRVEIDLEPVDDDFAKVRINGRTFDLRRDSQRAVVRHVFIGTRDDPTSKFSVDELKEACGSVDEDFSLWRIFRDNHRARRAIFVSPSPGVHQVRPRHLAPFGPGVALPKAKAI